ncbi:MAG TPA: methyltransferase domain-containing protein [Terriglobia bacterium]|nr:methyltransferase domain-containing protein [Terriglobia bacterium]
MTRYQKSIWLFAVLLLTGAPASAQVEHQEHHPPQSTARYIEILEDPSRDAWQQPQRVVSALGLKPGEVVADLGSGPGYFTLRFARAVGPSGKVYAIDISQEMLDYLEKQAHARGLSNIQTILAEPHDPKLPPDSVDLIFICDTLHHIPDRPSYYPFLMRALRPGGRLVNIDFHKRPLPVGPPVEMKISRAEMVREAEAAGFHLERQYGFLKYQYFLVFRR